MPADAPYRAPATTEGPPPPGAYEFAWVDTERRGSFAKSYGIFALTGAASGLAAAGHPWLGLVTAALGVGSAVWVGRAPSPLTVSVGVMGQTVLVTRSDGTAEPPFQVSALRDVTLDRKEIRRVSYSQPVGATLPNTSVSDAVDVARITLALEGGVTVRLSESYAAYSECMERYGKVRVFFRKHGWRPVDERDDPA